MSKYLVLAKSSKPYALNNGDVISALPKVTFTIPDECDSSTSIILGIKNKKLKKIEENLQSIAIEKVAEQPELIKKAQKEEKIIKDVNKDIEEENIKDSENKEEFKDKDSEDDKDSTEEKVDCEDREIEDEKTEKLDKRKRKPRKW